MRFSTLSRRSLHYYWRTNAAVVLGVAVTVAVLAGALLVGDSVRASLRELVLVRLGRLTHVIANENFFREDLAEDLRANATFRCSFADAIPLIVLEGIARHENSGRSASSVWVYGVDSRFWRFHALRNGDHVAPKGREALLSPGLAREFGARSGDSVVLRLQRPSDIPVESLHGRRDQPGRAIRLRVRSVLPAEQLGEFSLRPQQSEVRAVFVPLQRLQHDLEQEGRANTLLVAERAQERYRAASSQDADPAELTRALRESSRLEDLGVRLRVLELQRAISLESEQILIIDAMASTAAVTAQAAGMATQRLFTYLANTIRIGSREIPYSLVTAVDPKTFVHVGGTAAPSSALPPIWLNAWAHRDLAAKPGDVVTLDYYVWQEGGLQTESAQFELRGSVPLEALAADPHLVPEFPGITQSESVSDWNPPFPIDLRRIRPRDEEYWDRYRTAPKALLRLEDGQRLWRSRFGQFTALRFLPARNLPLGTAAEDLRLRLHAALRPEAAGFTVLAARAEGIEVSQGSVNFGEYFVYFSFFLVLSSVLLAGLFFRLGIEQRLREIGLLRAVGFPLTRVASLFLWEGMALSALGGLLGLVAAVVYGWLVLYGLRTRWVDAVGTTLLQLHVTPISLLLGGLGGVVAALGVIAWTLRSLRATTPVNLLVGSRQFTSLPRATHRRLRPLHAGSVAIALGVALLAAAATHKISQVGGFFGSGTFLLLGLVLFEWDWLARDRRRLLSGVGLEGVSRLGFRNASWRPGRSLLSITLIASATFVIVAVDSFRRRGDSSLGPHSGSGGYAFLAEALVPIPFDLNSPAGKESVGLSSEQSAQLDGVDFVFFRVRPGEDASCLNLYRPQDPKILGAPQAFLAQGRFSFQSALARTPEERRNPWMLLGAQLEDGAIPAIADANSMTYVLHRKLGDEIVLDHVTDPETRRPARLRLVAALSDSIFQSELIIAEERFLRLFSNEPFAAGYRMFLIQAPERQADLPGLLERALSDYGFDVILTSERLASFHRVENTYLSTFQALGGLGLLLGTVGLAAVLLRNVLERRRELALLRAVGYRQADLALMVLAENALLLLLGLASGLAAALLAIAPALSERGTFPAFSFAVLGVVLLTGFVASLAAVTVVVRAPLLEVLRSE